MITREFHFVEGASKKFWIITLNEKNHVVQYGRIGTAGQTQQKDFDTEDAAKKSCEKLIAEKLKKGYVEVTAGSDAGKNKAAASSPVEVHQVQASGAAVKTAAASVAKARMKSAVAESVISAAPVAQAHVFSGEIERSIGINASDWFVATWRNTAPLPKPEPQPFNHEAALKTVARITKSPYSFNWDWKQARLPIAMTREEAAFWARALLTRRTFKKGQEVVEYLSKPASLKAMTLAEVNKYFSDENFSEYQEMILPLWNLFSLEEVIDLLLTEFQLKQHSAWQPAFQTLSGVADGFNTYVLPYITASEREMIRAKVRRVFDPAQWPTNSYHHPHAYFSLAAGVGLHEELSALVFSWPDNYCGKESWRAHYHHPQEIIFGLGNAKLVESEMRRTKLWLDKPHLIRGWLAHTEFAALDYIRDSILAVTSKDEAKKLLDEFALVNAPEAAPFMLELMSASKAPQVARKWLEDHPVNTIVGLLAAAKGRGKLAEAAGEYLRGLRRKGYEPLMRQILERETPEIAAQLNAEILTDEESQYPPFDDNTSPQWLRDAVAGIAASAGKKITWIDAVDLPAVVAGGNSLNREQTNALLHALQQSALDKPHAFVAEIRKQATVVSREKFAWQLFERWLADGASPKEKWAMCAIGLLGGDQCVMKLTPLVREWPGESQHQRAVTGLECLRVISSDTALMQINGIAQKLKFKALKEKATECMTAIAEERGMSRAELEDRIVPDCDLDERGTRWFDYGPRKFRFTLGSDLKPALRDDKGKVSTSLPKPNAKDDAALAETAQAEWKLLKKQISDVVKTQIERLKQAMITGRRWKMDEFEMLLVRHPLMMNLTRMLIWGGHDATGKLISTFRLTEDQSFANSSDDSYSPEGVAFVSIVHPMHIAENERNAWGELLSDYAIIQPFPQLGRPIYTLEPGEGQGKVITRFAQIKIPAAGLVFTLDGRGWLRGIPGDGGCISEHIRQFPGADVTAVICYEGVPVGYYEGWDDQKIEKCFFLKGLRKPDYWTNEKDAIVLSEVDPVVISEVLRDLIIVTSKAK